MLKFKKLIHCAVYFNELHFNQQWASTSDTIWLIIIIMSRHQHRYLSPSLTTLPIVHYFWLVLRASSLIFTELLNVGSSWSPCLCSAMCRGPQEYITYELVPTSPAVSRISRSSNLIVFVMGGRWPYSCCFVGCCLQDLFNIARSILV